MGAKKVKKAAGVRGVRGAGGSSLCGPVPTAGDLQRARISKEAEHTAAVEGLLERWQFGMHKTAFAMHLGEREDPHGIASKRAFRAALTLYATAHCDVVDLKPLHRVLELLAAAVVRDARGQAIGQVLEVMERITAHQEKHGEAMSDEELSALSEEADRRMARLEYC